jgi:hypothetical protein
MGGNRDEIVACPHGLAEIFNLLAQLDQFGDIVGRALSIQLPLARQVIAMRYFRRLQMLRCLKTCCEEKRQ